tara:strand:- start:1752 stop:2342 length:591 start_codon:yes stop_codon:yes gene_type:complete
MEKKSCISDRLSCVILLVGIAIGVIGGMAIYATAYPVFHSESWAAWVQAAGVVGAVGVAVWVPHNDRLMVAAKERDSQQRKDYEMVRSLSILAGHAARAMASSTHKIEEEDRPIRIDRLKDVQESFRVMMAKELPSYALPHVLAIQCEIAYQISAIELHNTHQNNLSTKAERARKRTFKVRAVEEHLRALRDFIRQ